MRGGTVGSICLFAYFIFVDAEVIPLNDLNLDWNSEEDRSGAIAESSAISDGGDAISDANAESGGSGNAFSQSMASSQGGSSSAKSSAVASGDSQASAISSSNSDLSSLNNDPLLYQSGYPYSPGSLVDSGSSAQAVAKAQTSSAAGQLNHYGGGKFHQTGYPGSWSSGGSTAQAEAETNAQTHPGYPGGWSSGEATAQAEAEATAQSHPGDVGGWSSGRSTAHAEAEAKTQTQTGYPGGWSLGGSTAQSETESNVQIHPGFPGGWSSGGSTAQAKAEAKFQASGRINQGLYPYSKPNQYQPGYVYSDKGSQGSQGGLDQAETGDQVNAAGWRPEQSPYGGSKYQPRYLYPGQSGQENQSGSPYEEAEAQANVEGWSPGHNQNPYETKSRVIPRHEYIYPHLIPGYDNSISCSRFGELHYFQTGFFGCMICVCVHENNQLLPICASCSGCSVPKTNPPQPQPEPQPFPEPPPSTISPIPPQPMPQPEPQVSCNPLPSNKPFENPMNPCQICICTETYNYLGKPEVKIECRENPQCVIQKEVTTLPPLPDGPPTPLPICGRFPPNVPFPHPNDACRLCKCTIGYDHGILQPQIECIMNPDCNPVTYQPEPIPFPEVSTIVPWVPTTSAPESFPKPAPGPLPGPKPHESCRPFTPDQPFQHPWDECQMCICTESLSVGLITIEVNCYTKKSCCYELPELIGTTPVPHISNLEILDPICELKSFGIEFMHPQDACKVCFCDLKGNVVRPVCYQSGKPECAGVTPVYPVSPVYPNGGDGSEGGSYNAGAYAIAKAQTDSGSSNIYPGPGYKGPGNSPRENSINQASAAGEAYTGNKDLDTGYQKPGQQIYPGKPGKVHTHNEPGHKHRVKVLDPEYQRPGQLIYSGKPGKVYSHNQPGHTNGVKYPEAYNMMPYQGNWGNQDVIPGWGRNSGQWGEDSGQWGGTPGQWGENKWQWAEGPKQWSSKPGHWGSNQGYWPVQGQSQASASASAEAESGSQTGYVLPSQAYYYPGTNTKGKTNKVKNLGGIENLAEQEALDAWLISYNKGHPDYNYYPRVNSGENQYKTRDSYLEGVSYGGNQGASAQAQAEAFAQAGMSGYPSYGILDSNAFPSGVPASSLHPRLFKRPSSQITPLPVPGEWSYDNTPALNPALDLEKSVLASAKSSASSQGSNANTQAQASSQAYISKSGDPDFSGEEE